DGRRLPVHHEQDWLDVVAIHDGTRISLAITNMGGQQLALDLSSVTKRLGDAQATQTRLNYHRGEVVFQPEENVDPSSVPVDVNETTVVRLICPAGLSPSKRLEQTRYYATETALKSDGRPKSFEIVVPDAETITAAQLVIGAHRRGGISEPLSVTINGTPITIDLGDAGEFTEFFAPLDANVNPTVLREENAIQIEAQPETTITSVQLVTQSKVD
ncbi:MAG: hypothetical protein AAF745_13715, partial [Planctomycetota bacterium]